MTPIIQAPARWSTTEALILSGLYDTTFGKACSLLRRGDAYGLTALDHRKPRGTKKTNIYDLGSAEDPCVIEVSKHTGQRRVYDYKTSSYILAPFFSPNVTFWSVGETGVIAQHVQRLLEARSDPQRLRRDLQDPFLAAIYGRYLSCGQLETALA
jgi:hypothetical protein